MGLIPRRLAGAAWRRLRPDAPRWFRVGEFVTFNSRGFVHADSPEDLLGRHNHEVASIRLAVAGRRFGRSLEIGCGYGRLSPWFADSSDAHVAVDINLDALRSAIDFYPTVRYGAASATSLPFGANTFDFISTWTVLQHVPPHLVGQAFDEIRRVARPDALIVLCEATAYASKPPSPGAHTWDRSPEYYAEHLRPFLPELVSPITRLEELNQPPGTVMVFVGLPKVSGRLGP